MINDNEEFENNEEFEDLNLDLIKEKIPVYTSNKLCEMIVCDRYFGCYKEVAIMCMEELAKRRIAGDTFNFESYIDESLNKLPKLDFNVLDLGDVLRQVINGKLNE